MTYQTRRIFKSTVTSPNLIRELLQLMLMTELLAPGGQRAWLVSPWISNVVLFDNRTGGFNSFNPEWGSREIQLVEIAIDLMARGTSLGIATNFDSHNDSFLLALKDAAEESALAEFLTIVQRKHLHTKGILVNHGLLTGSMNLTYKGLELNEEVVVFDTTPGTIAEARLNFESYVSAI